MGTDEIPIFPLSNVVLFPRIRCPLHIFEPRYRQMTAHALASDQRIGMVTVRPDRLAEMRGGPPVFELGCAGTITEHQELPDGRYNLVLLGTKRFRILSEEPRTGERGGRLFRLARVELIEDSEPDADDPRLARLRRRAVDLAGDFVARAGEERARRFSAQDFDAIDAASLVNSLSNAFPFAPVEKQTLLEAPGTLERFERLVEILELHLAVSPLASPGGSRTVH